MLCIRLYHPVYEADLASVILRSSIVVVVLKKQTNKQKPSPPPPEQKKPPPPQLPLKKNPTLFHVFKRNV